MGDNLKAALEYEARGWSVIPLRTNSKLPAIQWAEFQRRRAKPAEIQSWWGRWPDANIGIVTGGISGIVAVDVDPRHGGKAEPIHKSNPTGLIQKTGSGGFHLLYAYPGGHDWIPNRASALPGVDVRADGGYIVAAPSRTDAGPYTWISSKQAGAPPRWAIEADNTLEKGKTDPWLVEAMKGVAEGERNDTMARLTGYFAAKDIPKDVAESMIRLWNQSNENPHTLTGSEIQATVASIYAGHRRRRKIRTDAGLLTPRQRTLNIKKWGRYATKYGDIAVDWLIDEWLPKSTICFVVSPPGTYKTWMLLDAAVSVASGKHFLGHWKVDEAGPVILFQQEDHHAAIVERVGAITWDKFKMSPDSLKLDEFSSSAVPDLPFYVHPDRALRFDDPDIVSAFVATMREMKPRLVIIDPLYTAVSAEGYMAEAAERMMVLKGLRDELGTTFMIAHHTRKSGSGPDTAAERIDAWGSQFLNAFLETGWQIRPTPNKRIIRVARHFKAAGTEPGEIGLEWHIDDEALQYGIKEADIPSAPGSKMDERAEAIRTYIHDNGPRSTRSVSKMLGVHPNIAHRLLRKMVERGSLIQDSNNKWALDRGEFEAVQTSIQLVIDDGHG